MTSYTTTLPPTPQPGWFARGEAWLDARGKGAWIAAMVLGFIFFWPVGLAILAYMIWSKRMFTSSCKKRATHMTRGFQALKPSGNSAFDAYKADTLARLEQEQSDFESFLARLRAAKDKAEFDDFMQDRARQAEYDAPAESDVSETRTEQRGDRRPDPRA